MSGSVAAAVPSGFCMAEPSSAEQAGPMATGAAHITINDELITFSFNVKRVAGGVVGQAQRQSRLDATIHYELTCLRVFDNKAIVGGIITRSTSRRFVEGNKAFFSVQDNGDGGDDPADRVLCPPRQQPPNTQTPARR